MPDLRSHALDRHAAILQAVEAGDAAARVVVETHPQQTADDVERYLGAAAGAAVSRS